MIPAVDESVLRDNPNFAALHHTLTTAILNPDGSTKNPIIQKERDVVRNELKEQRIAEAKDYLLIHAIATATPEPAPVKRTIAHARTTSSSAPAPSSQTRTSPPDPLLDLLHLLPPLLASPPLDPEATALLLSCPPFSDLPTLLPQLAPLISASIHASAASLARVADPATNPSYLHRRAASLADTIASRRKALADNEAALIADRIALASSLAALLAKHRSAADMLIKSLEGKHGIVARSLELRAEEVSLLARKGRGDALAAKDALAADVYSPDAVQALVAYSAHLRDARAQVQEAIAAARAELEEYGVGVPGEEAKEARMREMAKAYRNMERELEEVTRDLNRLRGA
ncbi:hypothetical protein B0T11DRAFT_348017 [Plectosphaerella cucumerina]|uniref:Uncharacterized protein n=1 Tax=Plectosphaerella cucumerina TaxID=40658 RepID=A0A8K0TI69_9PEZI|nr:hypothetical protein B0T11DRAFT_348017 [Plectosphaerella cucumerina]